MILPAYSLFGWLGIRVRDDAPSELCLDRVARLGRCGQLDVVEILEGRRLDDDDVTMHLPILRVTRAALQATAAFGSPYRGCTACVDTPSRDHAF